jgi:hypothetical protein
MTEKAAIWARRVAEWKSSGLTSEAYCAGRDFTAGGLRHWSHRLGKTVARDAERPSVLETIVRKRGVSIALGAIGGRCGRESACPRSS